MAKAFLVSNFYIIDRILGGIRAFDIGYRSPKIFHYHIARHGWGLASALQGLIKTLLI